MRTKWANAAVLLLGLAAGTAAADDSLSAGFRDPPNGARPRVWWHWMDGNVSKVGITLDLEWMKRTGIGGAENFQAFLGPMGPGKVVDKRLAYMSPEWQDAFHHAAQTADRLGLELGIAASPGWSETGGPWVTPAHAMKKYVWSETWVTGGGPFHGTLPRPPDVTGPFQALPATSVLLGNAPQAVKDAKFYADGAVVAYRAPDGDVPAGDRRPVVTASAGTIDYGTLSDSTVGPAQSLPMAPTGQPAWIAFDFGEPVTVRAMTVMVADISSRTGFGIAPPPIGVEASDDGQNFTSVLAPKVLSEPSFGTSPIPVTVAVPQKKARYFRVVFISPPPRPMLPPPFGTGGARPTAWSIPELVLHTDPRVERAEEKAGFVPATGLDASPTPDSGSGISKQDVIDLTGKMKPDGTLDWTPPPGRWVILRIGGSLLGITNHPAPLEATGLEVDKFSRATVKDYLDTYLAQYAPATKGLMGKHGLTAVTNDSWEDGSQNWTDDMLARFRKLRGYDPHPWLPVLTGRVVESAAASDRFLWDFRETLGDLLADEHYDEIARGLTARGLTHYGESHEEGRAFVGDGMAVKRRADVPMGAMWTQSPGIYRDQFGYNADLRESASVAHIYGQNLVAAESMTSIGPAWGWTPETLRPVVDKEFAMGVNRVVVHTSVHQPLIDKAPGIALGVFGQWFNRNETWAEQAKPWIDYIARNDYMLQQGHFVADVLYYYGEDSNITAIFRDHAPPIPAGYNFDYVNADALIHELSVKDGRIATKSGMCYRLIALDPRATHMSVPVLRALHKLVEAGAIVVGDKPADTPSLADDPAEFRRLADDIWGAGDGTHAFGKGRAIAKSAVDDAMKTLGIASDFTFTKPAADADLLYVHRTTPGADIYYVDNRGEQAVNLSAGFRVAGKEAELWHADTGLSEPASYAIADGRTTVPLALGPYESVYVVFRKHADTEKRTIPAPLETALASVDGKWSVSFDKGPCAPAATAFDHLQSWSESADPKLKYFSGSATYASTFHLPAKPVAGRVWLDLGSVKNFAEVTVNGKPLGIAWKPPYRVDATPALKAGDNTLAVKVTDLWVNRLIGDMQPGTIEKCTFTAAPTYTAESHLVPAGLLGPVRLLAIR